MLFKSEILDKWHEEMNIEKNLPPKGFRRNTFVYPLVCYVNNIICCYISKNVKPIPIFIERSRFHMERNKPKEELLPYYKRVDEYLCILEQHLKMN